MTLLNYYEDMLMKRVNNIYYKLYNFDNLFKVFDIVCKKTKNKRKVNLFIDNKVSIITKAYNDLVNNTYIPGKYKEFYIYEPKKRLIIETSMYDKYINHLVSEIILKETILSCLIDSNVASRKNKGTKYGLYLYYQYLSYYKRKYKEFYILKIDIKGFFSNINHHILIDKLKRKIKDQDALNIIIKIINSYESGLPIDLYSSQLLSIFYLNDFDHFIKENLHLQQLYFHIINIAKDNNNICVIYGKNVIFLLVVMNLSNTRFGVIIVQHFLDETECLWQDCIGINLVVNVAQLLNWKFNSADDKKAWNILIFTRVNITVIINIHRLTIC